MFLIRWPGTGGMAPEAPHMYKKDGYYYLMIAEGFFFPLSLSL
jgi:xylan 1,4-beta-xylosidase